MATTKETTSTSNNDEPEPTENESRMTELIAKDRPTIDAAVKSFISMVCARSMAASDTDATHDKVMMGIIPSFASSTISKNKIINRSDVENTNKKQTPDRNASVQEQVLKLARYILKAVNSYTFPIHDTMAYSMAEKPGTSAERKEELLEISVVARLWNALVESEQKPSRFLGRRALKLAWKNLNVVTFFPPMGNGEEVDGISNAATTTEGSDDTIDDANQIHNNSQQQPRQHQATDVRELQLERLKRFEQLLFESLKPLPSDMEIDDDSALLWAQDGGAAELAKRRQRRLDAAKERGPSAPS